MTPQRFQEVKRLFDACLEQPEGERARFAADALSEDDPLRTLLIRMVEEHERAERTDLAGRQLGGYELVEAIGRGATSVVYLARESATERIVAVKVLQSGFVDTADEIERFKRQRTATTNLSHPGIVSVIASGEEDGLHYVVMDFVEGLSLAELAERESRTRPQQQRRWVELIAAIADALGFAHDNGVVHRDVKPRNVIVDASGKPHLLDFGIAKFRSLSTLTLPGQLAGTVAYMSPEQALAARVPLDHRSDLFSLGVILHELLAGRRPFGGDTTEEVLYQISFREPDRLRSVDATIPLDLEQICQRALEKSPDRRYGSAESFAQDLRRHLQGQPIERGRPSSGDLVRRWSRNFRRPLAVGLGSAAVVSLVGLGLTLRDGYGSYLASGQLSVNSFALDALGKDRMPVEATVRARPLHEVDGPIGPSLSLGVTPLTQVRLAAGRYRLRVDGLEHGLSELSINLKSGASLELEALLRPEHTVTEHMVRIESGPYRVLSEMPSGPLAPRVVELEAYWIDRYEVSNAEYARYLETSPRPRVPSFWPDSTADMDGWGELPVVGITFHEAAAYCHWVGKRLPTLAEWQKAASGATPVVLGYPRPSLLGPPSDVIGPAREALRGAMRATRGQHAGVSTVGLHHALGNAAEWLDGIAYEEDGDRWVPQSGMRLFGGGDWATPSYVCDIDVPGYAPGNYELDPGIGIRCARTAGVELDNHEAH